MENVKARLSLEINGEKCEYTWNHSDISVDDIITALKGLMVSHTFSEKSIENYIVEKADEYYETED